MALSLASGAAVVELPGNVKLFAGTFTLDGAYPAGGGYPSIAKMLGLQSISFLGVHNKGGYDFDYSKAADKLKVSYPTGLNAAHGEVPANLAGLNALSVDFFAIGISST